MIVGAVGPCLNMICAGGIIKGLQTILQMTGLIQSGSGLDFIISAILCYPTINGVDLQLFGYTVNATYTSSFLPVIEVTAVAVPVSGSAALTAVESERAALDSETTAGTSSETHTLEWGISKMCGMLELNFYQRINSRSYGYGYFYALV